MITVEALAGYVLEELLAYELRASGLNLLVSTNQDPAVLLDEGNGLCIRGRGSRHQVDVLGELGVQPAFTFPIRLFVEAKCRGPKVGLSAVRNALGVVNDVNQHFSWEAVAAAEDEGHSYDRYHYLYVLFSSSGFSTAARQFAYAQQVSLVDLSRDAFAWLPRRARQLAAQLHRAVHRKVKVFPVALMRAIIRRDLRTWPDDETSPLDTIVSASSPAVQRLAPLLSELILDWAEEVQASPAGLFLVGTQTPGLTVAQPDLTGRSVTELPRDEVTARLYWGGADATHGTWLVETSDQEPLRLRLALPEGAEAWVLGRRQRRAGRAPDASTMTLILGQDLRSISFDPLDEGREPGATTDKDVAGESIDVERARRSRRHPEFAYQGRWDLRALGELLIRLDEAGRHVQVQVIKEAIASGGMVARHRVYEIGGYAKDRKLNRFTVPVVRITGELVKEGRLDPGTPPALTAVYADGSGRATSFEVPEEIRGIDLGPLA